MARPEHMVSVHTHPSGSWWWLHISADIGSHSLVRRVPVLHSSCTGYSFLFLTLQHHTPCIVGSCSSCLCASVQSLSLHPSQPAGEGAAHGKLIPRFHGLGHLPFLLHGLCEAPHQHCPPGGSSSLETGSKNAL